MAVILDKSGTSFRNAIYEDYKANRPPPPEDLVPQFPLIRDATRAFSLACIEEDDLEADDLIASYARAAADQGWDVTIVSSDKDLMQLVGPHGDGHIDMLDTMRNRMLLFGGRSSSSAYSNAVWAFDLATDTWSEVATTGTAPAPVAEAIATYDAPRDRLVVFGGDPGGFVGSDGMYSLDLATNTWSEITAAGAPSARLYHSSTQVGDELFVFGGATGFNPPYFNDVHGFDLATDTWRTVATTNDPQPRFGAELIADPANGRLLMAFGHDDAELGNRNDVYALDIATGAWSQLHTGDTFNNPPTGMCEFPADFTVVEDGTPERRYSIGLAQTGSVAYVFGGKADCGYLNDVWSLDIGSGAWTRVRASTGGEGCLRTGRTDCTTLCF